MDGGGGYFASHRLERCAAMATASLVVAVLLVLLVWTSAGAKSPPKSQAAQRNAPVVGIGDQKVAMFGDPRFARLKLRHVRLVVAWDALNIRWQRTELDRWMAAARAAGAEPLIAFTRSRRARFARFLPTPVRLGQTFRKFRRRYPWVRVFTPWNEVNHCSQPTCHRPRIAARYYRVMRVQCPGCTILAADVLDMPNMVSWLREFRRELGFWPRLWGLHNYIDVNRFRSSGTRALMATVPGRIWFTEVGGIVSRRSRRGAPRVRLNESPSHAARATRWLFRLARSSPRIQRIYLYHWNGSRRRDQYWDSGLIAPNGTPRPAYWVVKRELSRR
jgi:polysaccharide biosynthesis protein PslG